jgi:hypothetical protein
MKKIKVTLEMVSYWVGANPYESSKIIKEIANSKFESEPWTPNILHNDIIETWNENEDKEPSPFKRALRSPLAEKNMEEVSKNWRNNK